MKINSPTQPPSLAPVSGRPRLAQNSAAAAASTGHAASEEVSLSALSGHLQSGETQAPVNAARVAEIREAITQGRFSINAGAIADRLIDTARELIDSQRRA